MGWIACNNVISDLYAMGVSRIDNVLMLLSTSTKFTDKMEDAVLPQIMSGFRDCCFAAGTQVRGGQTTRNPWVLLGGCATSVLPKNEFVLPNGAKAGDLLVLTKPLGTQIAVNLNQWLDDQDMDKLKATGMNEDEIRKGYDAATVSMMTLNKEASSLMRKYKAHAATDVTGFGILGHAQNLVECQEDELDFVIDKLPILEKIASADDGMGRMFQLVKGYSAETSGGLLLAIDPIEAAKYITDLKAANGHDIWIIGKVTAGSRKAKIVPEVQIIDVTLNENEKLVST